MKKLAARRRQSIVADQKSEMEARIATELAAVTYSTAASSLPAKGLAMLQLGIVPLEQSRPRDSSLNCVSSSTDITSPSGSIDRASGSVRPWPRHHKLLPAPHAS